jgi:hypothetical protein
MVKIKKQMGVQQVLLHSDKETEAIIWICPKASEGIAALPSMSMSQPFGMTLEWQPVRSDRAKV